MERKAPEVQNYLRCLIQWWNERKNIPSEQDSSLTMIELNSTNKQTIMPASQNPVPKEEIELPASRTDQKQIGGQHYKKLKIQVWDYVIANDLDYFQGSIIKYVTRWRDKGGVQDLRKAMHFLEKYIEHEESRWPS